MNLPNLLKSLFVGLLFISACSELDDQPINRPPIILSVRVPAYVSAGDTMTVEVYDPESDTIDVSLTIKSSANQTVTGALLSPFSDTGFFGDAVASDGIFTGILNSAVLQNSGASSFTFIFEASQASGQSTILEAIVLQNPAFGHPPVISNLSAPDTVHKTLVNEFTLSVLVSDPDGLGDIASVSRVNVTLSGSPRSLNDDGENGDETMGDGIYTELVSVNPPPPNGSYLFRVQATDKLGLKSNSLEKIIVITD